MPNSRLPGREGTHPLNHEETTPQAARTRAANPQNPTAEQLAAARQTHWRQDENPLLTIEELRAWLQRSGLVLYAPKAQLGAPAPTLVEATQGKAASAPELAEVDAAKSLLARLIAEGSAVPLNLLGATGGLGTDQPDFVVSAAVFSYIFTLRGNKAWKQMPMTSGAVKVSPLALAAYEILSAKVTLSAYDLTTQLGKEVTEAAVLRALTELWSQLRVLPVPQQDGGATLWELASGRFTKQIKAGANAGQPSALSALISLYLGQAILATEDEVESFLSPLASRSRVRDVLHALIAARQLETVVIDGRTLLHVHGELPGFVAVAVAEPEAGEIGDVAAEGDADAPRISKFTAKSGSKIGTGLRTKPAYGAKPSFAKKPFGAKPAYGAKRAFEAGDRERRPFKRDDRAAGGERPALRKPSFDKPWQEDRPKRVEGEARPRREYKPREAGDGPRKTFSKPGTFGRKREGFAAGGSAEGRPPRREFGGRPERPASGGFKRPGSYSPKPAGERSFSKDRGGEGAEAPRKVFRKFDAPRGPKKFGGKPSFGAKSGFGANPDRAGSDRPKRSFDGARPERAGSSERGERPRSFGAKAGGFGAKKPFVKKAGGGLGKGGAAKGGPFAKFADGKKPFRRPGAPKKNSGGFAPTKRRREEDEA